MNILVLGATGKTGRKVVTQAAMSGGTGRTGRPSVTVPLVRADVSGARACRSYPEDRSPAQMAAAKLNTLLEIANAPDPRYVSFLLEVAADVRELVPVRCHVLKRLRSRSWCRTNTQVLVETVARIMSDDSPAELRLEAALTLGEFTAAASVVIALGKVALDALLPIDLRYSAFTSLQRAGSTAECVALLRQLSTDEALSRSAQSALATWHLE